MKNYLKYLKETKVFWILTLIFSTQLTIGLTFDVAKEINILSKSINDEYVKHMIESESPFLYRGLDASEILRGKELIIPIVVVFITILAVLYFVMYKQKSGCNSFSRLPISNGFDRIYELISAGAVILIELLVSLTCSFPIIQKINKGLLELYISNKTTITVVSCYEGQAMIPIETKIKLADFYRPKGLISNLEVYLCLGLIILCGLVLIHLLGAIVKYSPIGYVLGAVGINTGWLYFNGAEYFTKMSDGEYVNDYTALLGIALMLFTVSFIFAVKKEQPEKHKLFNYPLIIDLIVWGYVIFINLQTPIYSRLQYWILDLANGDVTLPPLDLFVLAAFIIYLIVKKRKTDITELPAMKRKSVFYEIIKPNIFFTLIATVVIATIYSYQIAYMQNDISGYWDPVDLSDYLMDIGTGFEKVMIMFVIYKFGWLLLKSSADKCEKFERITLSKRKLLALRSLAELVSVSVPLAAAVGFLSASYNGATGNKGIMELLPGLILYLAISFLFIASFAFAEYAYSRFIYKVTFLFMEFIICGAAVSIAESGFVIKGDYIASVTDILGIFTVVGIVLLVALVLFVTDVFICKKDLSRSTFRTAISEPVYILAAMLAYAIIVIECSEVIWQWIYSIAAGVLIFASYIVYRIISARKEITT